MTPFIDERRQTREPVEERDSDAGRSTIGETKLVTMTTTRSTNWLTALWLFGSLGCVTAPYQYGRFDRLPGEPEKPAEVAVDYGMPNKTLDRIGWVIGLPSRIFPLHAGVNNHQVSDETRDALTKYLEENDLTDVCVRINQYDPKDEWRRLRENRRIAAGWRYTGGVFCHLHYTLFPGRIVGGDWYNPYTNSLYINSDVQALVLHEAAYAKDIHSRNYPGTYSAINHVPLLWLWRQTVCVNDILSYAQTEENWEIEQQTYHVVYPLIGAHTGMSVSPLAPFGFEPVLGLGGALIGHATGRTASAFRAAKLRDSDSPTELAIRRDRKNAVRKDEPEDHEMPLDEAVTAVLHSARSDAFK